MKLNVYKNKIKADYGNGLLIVAAHDIEEAHNICYNSPIMEWKYWGYEYKDGEIVKGPIMYDGYFKDGFELIPNLTYEGEPSIIEEQSYVD